MRYKNLTDEQIKISVDRLTRFKFTKEKYKRVFVDIILANLLEPKLRKSDLLCMSTEQLKIIAEEIFNASLNSSDCENYFINKILINYENSIFFNDEDTQKLLHNKLNYIEALKLFDEKCPVNIKWLKNILTTSDLVNLRETMFLKYPIEKVLLVEGITEEILLPVFAKCIGYDFYQKGIQVIPAGGKNQVVKMYYKLLEELKIPIYLLLDKDAEDNIQQINPKIRGIDKIHLVSCGEFEDLLPRNLIIKAMNKCFSNFASINNDDFDDSLSTVKNLEMIFKHKGVHEFKKAEFAKYVKECIDNKDDISQEIYDIINEISDKTLDTNFCSC